MSSDPSMSSYSVTIAILKINQHIGRKRKLSYSLHWSSHPTNASQSQHDPRQMEVPQSLNAENGTIPNTSTSTA